MTAYIESGLRINLPEGEHFRFPDCEIYKQLSGKKLKEMDFGWWQKQQNRLWLIEIKDYAHLTIEERLPKHLLEINLKFMVLKRRVTYAICNIFYTI
jgi:hypothetical protein